MRYGKELMLTAALLLANPAWSADAAAVAKPGAAAPAGDSAQASEIERAVVTRHKVKIAGKVYEYTATAGTLTVRDHDGVPTASMFYVAYSMDGDKRRPVTFAYNGGPGSSSLWLHMASFAPRRVDLHFPHPSQNAPHAMYDNDESLLPYTDMVFLDAINTGYSRPLGDFKPESVMSADADIDVFARAIERYLTLNSRWNSPKYLLGESYGTSRSSGVANRLQKDGAQISGLIQVGSILDIGRAFGGGDPDHIATFPTMAVTAEYHGKIAKRADGAAFLEELREWVTGPYAKALSRGNLLGDAEKQAIADQMAAYTGLDAAFFVKHNLRISTELFRATILADQGKIVGRLDSRFTIDNVTPGIANSVDPSWSNISRSMLSVWGDYVREELKFVTDMEYRRALNSTSARFDFRRKNSRAYGYYGDDLAEAMIENPNMQVYAINGIYDFSTVFYGADMDYASLRIPANLVKNIKSFYHDTGHMAYVDRPSHVGIFRDIVPIYTGAQGAK